MEADQNLSIGDYLAAIWRRRLLLVGVAAPVVIIGASLALALPDVYRSTATFRLVTDRAAETIVSSAEYVDEYVLGLAAKVLEGNALRRVLRDADLDPDSASGGADLSFSDVRRNVAVQMVTQTVLAPGGGRERVINTGFTVSFNDREPERAAKVAAAVAREFVAMGRSDPLQAASNKVQFFSGEVDRLADQIAELEQRLAGFKMANFDRLPEAAQSNVVIRGRLEQELDGIDREIRTLNQNRIFVAQQLRQAQASPAAGNLQQLQYEYARKAAIYAETHPDMVELRRQIDALRRGGTVVTGSSLQAQLEQERAVYAEARQRYSEDHPDMRRMGRNIEALESWIAAGEAESPAAASDTVMSVQLQTQLNAIDTQISGLQARAGSIRSRLGQLDQQLGATPEVEREYQEITRGLDSARSQYNQMIARQLDAETEIQAITTGAADSFVLFSEPSTPWGPSGPPRKGILVISLLLSVVLALSAAIAAEILDPNVRGGRDVRNLLGTSPLAVVPEIHNSVLKRRRHRRFAVLASSLLIGAPVAYLLVHLLVA